MFKLFDKVSKKCPLIGQRLFQSESNTKLFEQIPGPKSYPLIGNLLALKQYGGSLDPSDICQFFVELHKQYGEIVKYAVMFSKPELYVTNPSTIQKVFQQGPKYPIRKSILPMNMYIKLRKRALSLASSSGEQWKRLRTATNPMLTKPYIINSYIPDHEKIIDNFIEYLNSKFNGKNNMVEVNNLDVSLKYLTFELITSVAFDKKFDCVNDNMRSKDTESFIQVLDEWIETGTVLMFSANPLWRYLPSKRWNHYVQISDKYFSFCDKYMDEALSKMECSQLPDEPITILQHLVNCKSKYDLTDRDLKSIMAEVLFGGIDSSASTLHFALYELGRNMEFQEKLNSHIREHYKPGENITQDKLENMSLLRATVKEVLRIHGVASIVGRELQENLVLDGYFVPAGTTVSASPFVIGRLPQYFDEPSKFDPYRWISPKVKIHPFISIWFGFGSRGCVGKKLAEQEIQMVLIKFITNYKFEYLGEDIKYKPKLNLMPDKPLKLKIEKRTT